MKELRESFEKLYALDPIRTLPYLISAATRRDQLEDYYRLPEETDSGKTERMEPLEEMAMSILMRHRDPTSTEGLIELGIRKLKSGEPNAAKDIFRELAARSPNGTVAQFLPSVEKAIMEAEGYETAFKRLSHHLTIRKAALVSLPALGVILGLVHKFHGEELSTVVSMIRELFIGTIAYHYLKKIGKSIDSPRLKVATSKAENDLSDAFSKLEEMGPRGFDILKALADNKLPGEAGAVIRQAAQRAIDAAPGMQAAQQVMEYAAASAVGSSPASSSRRTMKAFAKQVEVRRSLCLLNFAEIGHYIPTGFAH